MQEIIIKRSAEMTAEENTQVDAVSGLAYAGQGPNDIDWCSSDWMVMAKRDGQVVSLLSVVKREILAGTQHVLVGGIGGVATHPDFQRQGLAGDVLRAAAALIRDELGAPFGLLVCHPRLLHYYGKYGWQRVSGPMQFDWRGQKRTWHEETMILPLVNQPWPAGIIDLCGLPW